MLSGIAPDMEHHLSSALRTGAAAWSRTNQDPLGPPGLQPGRGPSPSTATVWCRQLDSNQPAPVLQTGADPPQLQRRIGGASGDRTPQARILQGFSGSLAHAPRLVPRAD